MLNTRPLCKAKYLSCSQLEASASSGLSGAMGETTGHATGSWACGLLLFRFLFLGVLSWALLILVPGSSFLNSRFGRAVKREFRVYWPLFLGVSKRFDPRSWTLS
jgi:hypothetical protein